MPGRSPSTAEEIASARTDVSGQLAVFRAVRAGPGRDALEPVADGLMGDGTLPATTVVRYDPTTAVLGLTGTFTDRHGVVGW